MSTIKGKFNIWTIAMFMGCLALSIIITQPLLARAGNEGGNDIIIDTTFSDSKSMSLNTLDIGEGMNIGGNVIITYDGNVCNSDRNCIRIDGNGIIVDKIQIGEGNSSIVFSGNEIINGNRSYKIWDDTKEDTITDEDLVTYFMEYHTPYMLNYFGLFERQEDNPFLADKDKPLFASKGSGYLISFKDPSNQIICSEDNAGTLHYIENAGGSQLIMCMKMNDGTTYSGVVLKDTAIGQ